MHAFLDFNNCTTFANIITIQMIQRIQSLFILLALICMCLPLFFPFGEIVFNDTNPKSLGIPGFEYSKDGESLFFSLLPLTAITSLSILISLVSIFLYKKRILQIRLNTINLVLQLGSIGLMFFYLYQATFTLNAASWTTEIIIIVPIVAAILTFLAIRSIARDEALVQSISRLR